MFIRFLALKREFRRENLKYTRKKNKNKYLKSKIIIFKKPITEKRWNNNLLIHTYFKYYNILNT